MSDSDLIVVNATILQLNAGLLALDVMLLSLVPALLIAVDQKPGTYVQGEKGKILIEGGLCVLRAAIVLFALGCLVGIVTFFYLKCYLLYFGGGLAGVGLTLIAIAAFRFARISRFIIRGGSV